MYKDRVVSLFFLSGLVVFYFQINVPTFFYMINNYISMISVCIYILFCLNIYFMNITGNGIYIHV